jgi:4-amino-4-deoxy-L-arabinose transferase-like glycosyltransferase
MDLPHAEGPSGARAATGQEARGARIRAWFRENGADLVNVLFLGAVALLVYTLDLDSVGIGGDAVRKWHFVRQWFYGNDFSHAQWDHHMARVGMNAIAYVAQLLLGRGPLVYYVPALFAGVVCVVTTYAVGKRLGGRFVGAAAALLLIVFKPAHTAATQFLPEVFSAMYATVAAYFFLRYDAAEGRAGGSDAKGRRRSAWLLATAIALFVGYLAKETTVFFLPGFALAILLKGEKRRFRDVTILFGVFAAGVALETATYVIFTDYAHRFAVVKTEHLYDEKGDQMKFVELFARFEKAAPEWKLVFYSYLPAALVVLSFAKKRAVTAIVAIGAIYYFLLTFLVRSINPIVIWQSFQSRYLDCASPFVFLTLAYFVWIIAMEPARSIPPKWRSRLERLRPLRHAVVPVLSAVIGFVAYRAVLPRIDEHPFRVLPRAAAVLNDAYRRNLPLISVRNANGLWAVYCVLLDDKLLAKDGQLPSYDEVKRTSGEQSFLVRDTSVYKGDKLRRLQRRHCAVEVMGKAGYTYVTPKDPLPAECDEELGK